MKSPALLSIALDSIPDLLALHQQWPDYYPHLLASSAVSDTARYDILFAAPQQSLCLRNGQLYLDNVLQTDNHFLNHLDVLWKQHRQPWVDNHLPFSGGWFLYLSYELAGQIEPSLNLPATDDGLPTAMATRFPAAIIVDHQKSCAHIVCEANFADELDIIQSHCQQSLKAVESVALSIDDLQEDREQAYFQQLAKLKQYIIDGDVFQVNLSRLWQTQLQQPVSHAHLFKRLSQANPGPFNALATFGEQAIISSSPERLIEVREGLVQTRPIAGTRPRSSNHEDDEKLSSELMAHPKERAEHIMLIDLERNDLGRICQPGSVEVNELMALESYSHVHHIVSNVRGRLADNVSPGEIIAAVFPGGTITGCPKVRCMEILAELEQQGRSAYTGSLGYLNHDGSMDLNILIRTLIRDGAQLKFRAGGGIVVDSDPRRELQETRAKARGMIMALMGV